MEFYPPEIPLPGKLKTTLLQLRPLRTTDNALDYEAVIVSRAFLRIGTGGLWPAEGFTPEENYQDLQRHEQDHDARVSFTFTILNLEGTECLGCLYVNSLDLLLEKYPAISTLEHSFPAGGATAVFWMRPESQAEGLDSHLLNQLIEWFSNEWSFPIVVYLANQLEIHYQRVYEQAGLKPLMTLGSPHRLTLFGK